MLDKIVLSQDRKSAVVHFTTHSVFFSSDEPNVIWLVWEIVLEPAIEHERRLKIAEEDTVVINLSDIDDEDAA